MVECNRPILYAHFGSREGILAEVAIEGFPETTLALEKARKGGKAGDAVESVAAAYAEFSVSSPALQGQMLSLGLTVAFDEAATSGTALRIFPAPGVVSSAELEGGGSIGTVFGASPWYRRPNKNQRISTQND